MRVLAFLLFLHISGSALFAATYYVAPSGSDSNPGSQSAPWRTFKKALSSADSGDTVYFMQGDYTSSAADPDMYSGAIRGGSSWGTATRFMAAPGASARPRWVMPRIPGSSQNTPFSITGSASRYIIFDGLEFDGQTNYDAYDVEHVRVLFKPSSGAGYIRWNNCDIHNSWHSNFQLPQDGAGFNEIVNSHIHHAGGVTNYEPGSSDPSEHHNVYIPGSNNIVDNNLMDHASGYDVHIYGNNPDNNTVRNNLMYDRSIVADGTGNTFYNNIFMNTSLELFYGAFNVSVIHNVFIGPHFGIDIYIADQILISNNIFYNTSDDFIFRGSQTNIDISNNLLSKTPPAPGGSVVFQNNVVNANPQFVNAAASDFRLLANSPAINIGKALVDLGVAVLSKDRLGNTRPQGAGWDAGAYEYGAGALPPMLPTRLRDAALGG